MIEVINATTIEDAWRQAIYRIFEIGRIYKIDVGSFNGSQRLEFYPLVVLDINAPGTRPLEVTVPEGKNVPAPSSEKYTLEYLEKLVDPSSKHENEDYVYADYVWPQIHIIIEKLSIGFGNTNQATITVGDRGSILLHDPPCLKVIDFRLSPKANSFGNQLDMLVYFRSWDLWAGFPNNLAALELLREYVWESLVFYQPEYLKPRFKVEDTGHLIAISKGLHLYDYCWPYAEILNNKKLEIRENE